MPNAPARLRRRIFRLINILDRLWVPLLWIFFLSDIYLRVTQVGSSADVRTSLRSIVFLVLIVKMVRYVQRIIDQNEQAFELINQMNEARLPIQLRTRQAAESLVTMLEIIREELRANTRITVQSADANATAAKLTLETAEQLQKAVVEQRETVAAALEIDRNKTQTTSAEILNAVGEVNERLDRQQKAADPAAEKPS